MASRTPRTSFRAAMVAAVFAAGVGGARQADAGKIEISGWGGVTAPVWSETFNYGPGQPVVLPGLGIKQEGQFELEADGGLAMGASFAFFPTSGVGFEGRFDSVRIDVMGKPSTYKVTVLDPPAPIPQFSATVTFPPPTTAIDALTPWSLNLKLRSPGAFRFYVSGGLSYLPSSSFEINQRVGLGATGFTGTDLVVSQIRVTARQAPDAETGTHWGWNAGLGFELGLGEHAALVAEARYFQFTARTIEWTGLDVPGSGLDQLLRDKILEELEPLVFDPLFFQATAGLVVRF